MVGKTLAQYTILAKLGGGGMGVVYRAKDAKLGRLVALKFLPPQWSHDETAKQRFIREAQAASATDHANICTIHDIASTDDGQLFIVMAHYEGETLKQRLERGVLPVGQRRIEEALSALEEIGPDSAERTLGAELQAQVHYWRGQALAARGDRAGAQSEESTARALLEALRRSIPEPYHQRFASRPDIRLITG